MWSSVSKEDTREKFEYRESCRDSFKKSNPTSDFVLENMYAISSQSMKTWVFLQLRSRSIQPLGKYSYICNTCTCSNTPVANVQCCKNSGRRTEWFAIHSQAGWPGIKWVLFLKTKAKKSVGLLGTQGKTWPSFFNNEPGKFKVVLFASCLPDLFSKHFTSSTGAEELCAPVREILLMVTRIIIKYSSTIQQRPPKLTRQAGSRGGSKVI